MKHTDSLNENHLFRRLYHRGSQSAQPCLVLYALPNRSSRIRLGMTVSPKLGKAVLRNRIKRRLREAYRLQESHFKSGMDLVIVARARAANADFGQLQSDLLNAARNCRVLQ